MFITVSCVGIEKWATKSDVNFGVFFRGGKMVSFDDRRWVGNADLFKIN